MLPKWHILISAIASIMLFFVGVSMPYVLVFFFSAFLIDFDHYLAFMIEKRSLNLKKAYDYFVELGKKCERGEIRGPLCIFHTVEFLIVFAVISYFNLVIFAILAGFVFHISADVIHGLITKTLKFRNFSIIGYLK